MTPTDPLLAGSGSGGGGRSAPRAVVAAARGDLWKALAIALAGVIATLMALRRFAWARFKSILFDAVSPTEMAVAVTPFDVLRSQSLVAVGAGACLALPAVVYYGRGAVDRWPSERLGRRTEALFVPLCSVAFLAGVVAGYGAVGPAAVEVLFGDLGVGSGWSVVQWGEVGAGVALLCGLVAQAAAAAAFLAVAPAVAGEAGR
ncbi:twin-arginine translocase subunit TatC [Halomicrobium salinisoli]|uniref:twin-arginine translocase subunit TatC n=1 Tax=Halomicrobium salinisoli TaxID=2878391 RepID=UPI001CF0CBDB|nr:twin-arginine translocase subunit TatC [Halomicrobium salinisoli]